MAPFKVIIIGCGLSGGLLGNGLLHNDVDFTIYESDDAKAGTKRDGYQIRLGSHAIRGFKACLTDDQQNVLYKMFGRSGGVLSAAPILYDTQFRQLLDLTKFPAYSKSAPINRVVLRDYLQEKLVAAGRVQFGKKFTGYSIVDENDSGVHDESLRSCKVRVQFADGSEDECDLLISAEGSRSRINKQIGLDNIVQLQRCWGFLAKGSLPRAKLLALGPEVHKGPVAVISDGIALFYSAYLPKGTENSNRSEARHEDTSNKDNVPEFDEEMSSLFWGLLVPVEKCPENPLALEDKIGFCLESIKHWDPRFEGMLRAIDNDDVHVFQPRASNNPGIDWRSKAKSKSGDDPSKGHDQVWLLGDAIHPMLPSRGMGANQSMSDTADMLPEIVALRDEAKNLGGIGSRLEKRHFTTAVQAYESKMIPRAFHWVKMSGGTDETVRDPSSFSGKIMLFFVAQFLTLAHLISQIKSMLGYKVTDDAPELPD
ncbi:hypothetical protein SEUCBS139899_010435 [Sporothrix eucalyptigena]|uniref:FAD-binding domain-containing protein n=1 Tax=Sporothrix eucalyptigena TaxID=1812306 RepID=A0ABP0CLY6_9PEZI